MKEGSRWFLRRKKGRRKVGRQHTHLLGRAWNMKKEEEKEGNVVVKQRQKRKKKGIEHISDEYTAYK